MIATNTDQQINYQRLAELKPNPLNPRGAVNIETIVDLVASIREHGILQPLVVNSDGTIVAGHRRYEAARRAGLDRVPVVVRTMDERTQVAVMLTENLQREDLSHLQEARAYQRLIEMGMTQMQIVRSVGQPAHRVRARLAILQLAPSVQEIFSQVAMPLRLPEALAKLSDPRAQHRLATLAAQRRVSTAHLENLIARMVADGKETKPKASPAPRPDLPPEMPAVGRAEAMALLAANKERVVAFPVLAEAMDEVCGICGECGMSRYSEVCGDCALPKLVKRLV